MDTTYTRILAHVRHNKAPTWITVKEDTTGEIVLEIQDASTGAFQTVAVSPGDAHDLGMALINMSEEA